MNIYICNVEHISQQILEDGYKMLDISKKRRIDRIEDNNKKKVLIVSDMLARFMVNKFTGISKNSIKFAHSSHGKPILQNGHAQFNISHSGNYCVGCIDKHPCGIDIEFLRDVNLNSAKRFCTDNELQYINNSRNKNTAFLKIWTKKEAYFKSIGCGIATVLSSVDVLKEDKLSTVENDDFILSVYSEDSDIEVVDITKELQN